MPGTRSCKLDRLCQTVTITAVAMTASAGHLLHTPLMGTQYSAKSLLDLPRNLVSEGVSP